jgi:hypothetical protein
LDSDLHCTEALKYQVIYLLSRDGNYSEVSIGRGGNTSCPGTLTTEKYRTGEVIPPVQGQKLLRSKYRTGEVIPPVQGR